MKLFEVGVFPNRPNPKLKSHYNAYTTWYNPEWEDCIYLKVLAKNGTEAKKKAINIVIKDRLMENKT